MKSWMEPSLVYASLTHVCVSAFYTIYPQHPSPLMPSHSSLIQQLLGLQIELIKEQMKG